MNIGKYIENGYYKKEFTMKHTLYHLAKYKGYSDALCMFLHVKTLENLYYNLYYDCFPHAHLDVLAAALIDGCKEMNILKMAFGTPLYVPLIEDDSREYHREEALKSGKKAFKALLDANGDFDYRKAYMKIVEDSPEFAEEMRRIGHPLDTMYKAKNCFRFQGNIPPRAWCGWCFSWWIHHDYFEKMREKGYCEFTGKGPIILTAAGKAAFSSDSLRRFENYNKEWMEAHPCG